jgi:type II secretory pathway pseudopilin PulG
MQRRQAAITLVELLVVIAVIGIVIALLIPSVRSAREPARRNSCMNNLKNISLALLRYEEEHGSLPPAYTVDEQGKRLHSWRALLLPYLEQSKLFESIDLSKPWDDPANAKARDTVVEVYQCPSSPELNGLTNYLGVVGPDCAFSGSVPRELSEVKDGPVMTVAVIDVGTNRAVPWMSPQDISEDGVLELVPDAKINHPGIMLAAFLDGSARSISQDVDPIVLRAILTISGGEEMKVRPEHL